MDGNGRWAEQRGWPRLAGHQAGATAVRRVVEASRESGIGTLTLFAFSADNWRRPPGEVSGLMRLFADHLRSETQRCVDDGVRLSVIGRRDRLPRTLIEAIEATEAETVAGTALHLRLAVDYSARDSIVRAAEAGVGATLSREAFARLLAKADGAHAEGRPRGGGSPEVDLLIRTGGERRLSDFLLWESAYAELFFTRRMWPDFGVVDLNAAIASFQRRERRFGGVPKRAASSGIAACTAATSELSSSSSQAPIAAVSFRRTRRKEGAPSRRAVSPRVASWRSRQPFAPTLVRERAIAVRHLLQRLLTSRSTDPLPLWRSPNTTVNHEPTEPCLKPGFDEGRAPAQLHVSGYADEHRPRR
jgi:undecaprenyl diphosphate synthase